MLVCRRKVVNHWIRVEALSFRPGNLFCWVNKTCIN